MPSRQVKFPTLQDLLEIDEALQDIKTADAILQNLQNQEVPIAQDDHQASAMEAIVNALVAIVALFLTLFGFRVNKAPAEEDTKSAKAVKKVSLERKKAEKMIKRTEAYMHALDRLVEAQQLYSGDNWTGSWEMVQR
ncbi:uncharacterized protein FSUBG_13721 [Fusarium subglutinans]|uniref:Uncharacterized protein n=1 Tax=Gibberella subglutinans TaxID=42677 RepID=A0A8H5KQS9_GIBSU|nr:uncharacterized protein FSUBG_13721 [Fusarium subglutinans]KAF5578804.1 hypothetical protein FSUBG_13721 [Fusarium subglutinans]